MFLLKERKRKATYFLACASTSNYMATMQLRKLANKLTNGSRSCRDKDIFPFLRGANLKESSISSKTWHTCVEKKKKKKKKKKTICLGTASDDTIYLIEK